MNSTPLQGRPRLAPVVGLCSDWAIGWSDMQRIGLSATVGNPRDALVAVGRVAATAHGGLPKAVENAVAQVNWITWIIVQRRQSDQPASQGEKRLSSATAGQGSRNSPSCCGSEHRHLRIAQFLGAEERRLAEQALPSVRIALSSPPVPWTLLDGSPQIGDVRREIEREVRYAADKQHIAAFVDRLEVVFRMVVEHFVRTAARE